MDKYYYVVTQLPMLFFEREPDISSSVFMEEAEKWLSPKDFNALTRARFTDISPGKKKPKTYARYRDFELAFRTELARWRQAVREGQEYKPQMFPSAMIKEGNPLEVEKAILRFRWHFIDEMQTDHHFDLDFVVLYYLKLQILEQLFTFDKEKGLEKFQQISKVSI